ncbi:MAG: hypothetical protein AABZ58_02210 [Chloroflexota bacterium]
MTLQAELAAILEPGRVLTRPLERIAYASDASFYRLIPQAVVQPVDRNHADSGGARGDAVVDPC